MNRPKDMRTILESAEFVFEDNRDDAERLTEIKEEIKCLVGEAEEIIKFSDSGMAYERAKSYWIGHILTSLDDESMYAGTSMTTMQDTIDEIRTGANDPNSPLALAAEELEKMFARGVPDEEAIQQVVNDYGVDPDELDAFMNER